MATRDASPTPFVFKRARQLVRKAGKDVAKCLSISIQTLAGDVASEIERCCLSYSRNLER